MKNKINILYIFMKFLIISKLILLWTLLFEIVLSLNLICFLIICTNKIFSGILKEDNNNKFNIKLYHFHIFKIK